MQSSVAQSYNFQAYRAWSGPLVDRPGCPAYCLVGVSPLDKGLRA